MDFKTEVVPALLGANLSVFSHTFGTKKVNITTLQRRKKILKSSISNEDKKPIKIPQLKIKPKIN